MGQAIPVFDIFSSFLDIPDDPEIIVKTMLGLEGLLGNKKEFTRKIAYLESLDETGKKILGTVPINPDRPVITDADIEALAEEGFLQAWLDRRVESKVIFWLAHDIQGLKALKKKLEGTSVEDMAHCWIRDFRQV